MRATGFGVSIRVRQPLPQHADEFVEPRLTQVGCGRGTHPLHVRVSRGTSASSARSAASTSRQLRCASIFDTTPTTRSV